MHVYEVSPHNGTRGVNLVSDALPSGRLWCTKAVDAVDYAKSYSGIRKALLAFYDAAGNVIETHEHKEDFTRVKRQEILPEIETMVPRRFEATELRHNCRA